MVKQIETLDDLLKLTNKTLKITTIKDTNNYYTTLQEINYDDKYVYFGIHSGYPEWIRNKDSSKITEDFVGFNQRTYNTVYDFAKYLGIKVAVLSYNKTMSYTEDYEVFRCIHCGKTHISKPYDTIIYYDGMICDQCYDELTDDNCGEIDTGIIVETVRYLYHKGDN